MRNVFDATGFFDQREAVRDLNAKVQVQASQIRVRGKAARNP
jgi:hypothetical protein